MAARPFVSVRRTGWTLALYGYRQFDAPRTDQCPPPGARFDECLTITEQFRTLGYAKASLVFNDVSIDAVGSWQRQLERREGVRPASFVESTGRDVVESFGGAVRVTTRDFAPTPGLTLRARGGADTWIHCRVARVVVVHRPRRDGGAQPRAVPHRLARADGWSVLRARGRPSVRALAARWWTRWLVDGRRSR